MRRLPPLAAIRVFEAAARHENFTLAGAELAMTQAAVSYQVRLLEERVGMPLFLREKRRVTLTEPGRRLATQLSAAFDAVDAAFTALRAEDEQVLTISTSNTFANTWFAWRLGGFQLAHPAMGVRLRAEDALVDFASSDVDVAVRSGRGDWPGLAAELLFRVDFTPMCSPDFLAAHGGTLSPADVRRLPRISAHDPWWDAWLDDAGIEGGAGPPPQHGIRMENQSAEGNAAIAGLGLAMLTPFFWRMDMAAGRLMQPFDQLSTRNFGYWLVYPEHRRTTPKIRRFRDWLVAEIARDRESAALAKPLAAPG